MNTGTGCAAKERAPDSGYGRLWPLYSSGNAQQPDVQDATDRLISVSLVRLLVDPEEFIGQRVAAIGYLAFGGSLRLFLTKDHSEVFDITSSIRVADDTEDASLSQSSCLDHYVYLEGTLFVVEGALAVVDIERVLQSDDIVTCWARD